jgi:hypothetical protein
MNNSEERLKAAAAGGLILPEILDVPLLALATHKSEKTVRDLLHRGLLPGRKVGRTWLTSRRDLLRLLATHDAPRFDLVPPAGGPWA